MPVLGTLGSSPYNNLLKASIPGGAFFKIALYPPVFQNEFNVGTVFSICEDGLIETVGEIVRSFLMYN
jgi:hypothetical protein